MESTKYLNSESTDHGESGVFSESRFKCFDRRNSLAHFDKLMNLGGNCYADFKSGSSEFIKTKANPDIVSVDFHEQISSIVKSSLIAIDGDDSFHIKLSLNRDSIQFLRRSLKLIEDRLESIQSTINRKWQSKVNSYLESIQRYDETDHQSSTDESESENESQVYKKTERDSNFNNDHDAGKPIDGINRTLEKRFELKVYNRKDFWFYSRNLIQNGHIQVQNFPVNLCSYSTDHLYKRLQTSTELNPDPCVFSHVKHKKPLDESDFEQLLAPKIRKGTAKRVLKGMSQGRLYNIDLKRLRQIFVGFIRKENGKVKCPLCGMVYTIRSSVIEHLESIHTNFACFCGQCGQLFVRSSAARTHKCPSKNNQMFHM